MIEPAKRPGDTLAWTSSANGGSLPKRGRVVAIVAPGEDAKELLLRLRPGTAVGRIRFDARVSPHERYLVEVPRPERRDGKPARGTGADYYAPLVKVIDKKLREAEEARRSVESGRY